MADLARLKQEKRQFKSTLTRLANKFSNLNLESVSETEIKKLELRYQNIQGLLEKFTHVHGQIALLERKVTENDESDATDEELDDFEERYFDITAHINDTIKKFNISEREPTPVATTSEKVTDSSQAIKLPPIELMSFGGDYEQWPEYCANFTALINENVALCDYKKFHYLKSSLKGEAREVIQSIQHSSENYSVAWRLLKTRYDNKKIIKHKHVTGLLDLPNATAQSLRVLYDKVNKHVGFLEAQGEPVHSWDTLLTPIISQKLDKVTRREWEKLDSCEETLTFADFMEFLRKRCDMQEKLDSKLNFEQGKSNEIKGRVKSNSFVNVEKSSAAFTCFFCNGDYSVYKCEILRKVEIKSRSVEIKKRNLCTNCLRPGHNAHACSHNGCKICGRKHNSLLHINARTDNSPKSHETAVGVANEGVEGESKYNDENSTMHTHTAGGEIVSLSTQVLLSTAIVSVSDSRGQIHRARCLLDSGSQCNYITRQFFEKLNLPEFKINYIVSGIGQALSNVRGKAKVDITSLDKKFKFEASCLVLERITNNLPVATFKRESLSIPKNVTLADPTYNMSQCIDILLGIEIFYQVLCAGQFKLVNGPTLQKTRLGWIIAGSLNSPSQIETVECLQSTLINNDDLNASLKNFWRLDECESTQIISEADAYCEEHFVNNTTRDQNGRFVVRIPFKDNRPELGISSDAARARFFGLEKRLLRNDNLRIEYNKFMSEYLELDHMTLVSNPHDGNEQYFMPHHCVIKESSSTTKLSVFDGSMKSNNNLSLNDIQHSGPTMQRELYAILLGFRQYKFVMSADIMKMYRMVLINKDDRRYQRIWWRFDPTHELQCFELNTVTYGTSSAAFLAIRSIYQLAIESETKHPMVAEIIKNNFYVDDVLFGSDSRKEILQLKRDLTYVIAKGGFELHKWLCNFEVDSVTGVDNALTFEERVEAKTLGVMWDSSSDVLRYNITKYANEYGFTKRSIVKYTAQVFDPLGYLGPYVVTAKIIIQSLWKRNIDWDENLPQDLLAKWKDFTSESLLLNRVTIPRHVILPHAIRVELHIFADATEKAYGACAYIKSITVEGNSAVNILLSKSRVAPCKKITLPRLELCAAVLLTRLLRNIKSAMSLKFDDIFSYTDSTIVLAWIRGDISKWKTFVANRVSEIRKNTRLDCWKHVRSADNPADLLSRGITAHALLSSDLWWHGPRFLRGEVKQEAHSEPYVDQVKIPEQKTLVHISAVEVNSSMFAKYSEFGKMRRICAFMMRFIANVKAKPGLRQNGPLTVSELGKATNILVRMSQLESYCREYNDLSHNRQLNVKSPLLCLNPFMDDEGLMRVGGRLKNAACEYDKKHPIILSPKHAFTKLIMRFEHIKLMHCGPTALLASLRDRFWPVAGRSIARIVVRSCVRCFRANPKVGEYLMGNLPSARVNQYLPFTNTGCDYAGPFYIKDRLTRNARLIKAYVCVFVCMSIKAIHLEIVTDLTAECFIACLRRFVARRGKPSRIFSDNGTAFVGANNKLKELSNFLRAQADQIISCAAHDNIDWSFIPARSPNFGGLWEAGVKSFKFHFVRIVGNANLTYEQFHTVSSQIEAILNSRPLCPLSLDPDDSDVLTPAHFLIGKSLTNLPERSVGNVTENRLKIFERLQRLVQHFWKKWHQEYISELQGRVKWKKNAAQLARVGSIVLLKDENLPPCKWSLGKVVKVLPGDDETVRVVHVQLANRSIVSRGLSKVCVLPIDSD